MKSLYLANHNVSPYNSEGDYIRNKDNPFYPRFWPGRILDFTTKRIRQHYIKPMGIFVCDMGELFGDWIPEEWQEQVFWAIKHKPQHRFYLLTKQPQNLIKFSPFPDNCWVGVTAIDTDMAVEGLTYLKEIQATIKYMSFEPLLDYIPLTANALQDIDWVIIGAQTRPTIYPKIEWVEEIVRAADKAGIPVFLKDNLKLLIPPATKYIGLFYQEHPSSIAGRAINLRQEMPDAK